MTRKTAFLWGAAILMVALLNIIDILPDWATFAAVLTLPLMATWRCAPRRRDGERS
ncbi:hypothetical protein [Croceicoccus mobilis]|uniref:Uncharacterized protein n=1 Tax=Croceicoccus mobilis TaxID=1703339 RepID=A0A917DS42_9SPHN|nr:hypothetical protein [Croceicoccus mobilis]GGD61405.1 hypothetical protein GCM10010990_08630 [Croceicoccus mobilis]